MPMTMLLTKRRRCLYWVLVLLLAGAALAGLARWHGSASSVLAPEEKPPQASQQRLYADVEFLTALRPARSYQNPTSLNQAADYIKAEFGKLGGRVEEQPFAVGGRRYRNIIASFGPAAAERIIVGAHYDVCGNQPGADDNASAVAGLLETARLLAARPGSLTRRIDFVAYSLEEPPFFATNDMGSAVHAKSLHDQKVPVRAMLGYEMIGYFTDAPGSQSFPSPQLARQYPSVGNFIMVVGQQGQETLVQRVKTLMQAHASLDVQSISLPATTALAGLSDHRNYWRYGYPALMINDTAFLRNRNYHRPSDTIDTLDFARMAQVVDGVLSAILAL